MFTVLKNIFIKNFYLKASKSESGCDATQRFSHWWTEKKM